MRRDMSDYRTNADGESVKLPNGTADVADTPNRIHPIEDLDVLIVGAGFAGCYILYQLRKQNFKTKIVEAGSDLGGIWYVSRPLFSFH